MDNIASLVATRCSIFDELIPGIVQNISQVLSESNHYVHILKTAKEIFEQEYHPQSIKVVINEERRPPSGAHARRYNSPVSDEIDILMPDNNTYNRIVV